MSKQNQFMLQVIYRNYNTRSENLHLHYKSQYTEGLNNYFIINDYCFIGMISEILHFIFVVLLGWLNLILKKIIKLQLSHLINKKTTKIGTV